MFKRRQIGQITGLHLPFERLKALATNSDPLGIADSMPSRSPNDEVENKCPEKEDQHPRRLDGLR